MPHEHCSSPSTRAVSPEQRVSIRLSRKLFEIITRDNFNLEQIKYSTRTLYNRQSSSQSLRITCDHRNSN